MKLLLTLNTTGWIFCALLPAATAAPKTDTAAKSAPAQYRAACGMIYSAAEAKKDHYICPMDHKKMVAIIPAPASAMYHAKP